MSRPRKPTREPVDTRTDVEPGDHLARVGRQFFLNELRTDPLGDEPLACILGPVILRRATDGEKQLAKELFTHILETGTAEQVTAFFARVRRLKESAELPPHRNALAYYAYSSFIEETGREPSKPELRKYIVARREIFKGAPAPEDGKAWHRLWEDCGLFELPKK